MSRIWYIIKKEFILYTRDPRMLFISMMMPVVQLIIFGFAVTTDIKQIDTVVWDEDKSQTSRQFINRFTNSGYFNIVENVNDITRWEKNIHTGKSVIGIHIPIEWQKKIQTNRPVTLPIAIDGSDSNLSTVALNYTQQIVTEFQEEITRLNLSHTKNERGSGLTNLPRLNADVRVWYNPALKSTNYMIPGIISLILMFLTSILTSMAITKERELGTIEQVIVTPIRPYELMVGKIVTPAIIGFIDIIVIIFAGWIIFSVSVKGSLVLLFFTALIFLLTSLGIGLFVSAISFTQQQAMMTAFFIMLPQMLLSGFMFPIENMPVSIQYFTYLLPLRYFLVIVRGIYLKGVGINILWPQIGALLVFGILIIWISATLFKKRVS